MKRKALAFLVSHIFWAAAFCQLQAQTLQGAFQGKVLDPSGAPISAAEITVVFRGRIFDSTVSDESGRFSLTLAPGEYTLQIAAKGFLEASQAVEFPPASSETKEFVLQIAGPREMVTVTESPDNQITSISSATKTMTPLRDVPQSITVVTQEQARDQLMTGMGDVVRYVPGITTHQGENNRDQVIIRGNNSSADFFVNGVRDDVQYYRDLYNLDRVEALKGPNAMIFGRGGGGGVINRVTKEAGFTPIRDLTLQGGSFASKRIAMDIDTPVSDTLAFRLNGMFENSGSFRNQVRLERHGISPTLTITPNLATRITLTYENFRDTRTADRGIPSFDGRPADISIATFFGNPDDSHVKALVNLAAVAVEHRTGALSINSRMHVGDYDRSYQNFVPGLVSTDKAMVALSVYNNATHRRNIFNQTDLTYVTSKGGMRHTRHTFMGGIEVGRQLTDNFRQTGFFNNADTSILVPYANPTINTPVTFRQNAADADNHLRTNVASAYIQDQIGLSRYVEVIAGLRFDHFDLHYHNNRTKDNLRRIDNLVSPRAGIVLKPVTRVSAYVNYSVSSLPSSGDQFSSLTTITQQVKPEKFNNYEVGVKWDVRGYLSLTTAAYRLNRTNTRATDPTDPTRIVQTGSQRTNGYELGVNGSVTPTWKIAGGYAYQDAFITNATAAARTGAQVAQVPHHTFSLWNNYRLSRRLGAGLGVIHRTDMYAAVDNTVTLPGYTRVDAAIFLSLTEKTRFQANVENVFNRRYYVNADNNTNISPGAPRTLRIGLTARF